jgi:hypothetical protein
VGLAPCGADLTALPNWSHKALASPIAHSCRSVHKRRNKHAALKVLRRLLRNQGVHPESITSDKWRHTGSQLETSG